MFAEVLDEDGDGARFEAARLVNAVDQVADLADGQARTEEFTDVSHLFDGAAVEQSLPS